MPMSRRTFLRRAAAAAAAPAAAAMAPAAAPAPAEEMPPVRPITRGPAFHWFGYYDKLEFDPASRCCLGMEVDFEHRSPQADDVIRMGMVDTDDGDRWTELGESRSWGWQQGCMLQWRPGSETEVLWNDRQGDRFVCRILDTKTRRQRTIPHPVYTVGPDGATAVAPDFARIQDMRPGYGYPGLPDSHRDEMAPKDSGLWRVDLEAGRATLIVSLADIAAFGTPHESMHGAKHYFNHLLFNTDGSRFIFLHRWRPDAGKGGFITRMLTAAPDGSGLCEVDPSGHTSHFIWRDPEHILAWTCPKGKQPGFYLFKDRSGQVEQIGAGVMTANGHCTCLPGNEWILNDTYPQGKERLQTVYLYHAGSGRKVILGRFHLPPEYKGEWRCDTHPRFSPDGRKVVIDSPHAGQGRQLHLIDIRRVLG